MKISQRARSIAPFLAMEFGQRAAALAAQGHDVVRLNLGEPDYGAPPAVVQAAQQALAHESLGYTDALGLPALRQAIAGFYQTRHGVTVDPARVVVTAGASAALLMLTAALVDPGDEVLVGDPSYPCNRQFLSSYGAQVKLVPVGAASGFQLDLASVQAHWSAHTRGVMIATPSNPTGTSVPAAELAALCDWVREQGGWRIVDEIYLNLADPGPQGDVPQTVLAVDAEAVVVNSFSKYFGMTGWRLGWCVVPEALVPVLLRLAQNFFISPPTLAQHAALACFTPASLAVCEARRHDLVLRRQKVLTALAAMGLAVPVQPDGAFYVYVDVRATGLNAWEFCRRALDEAHVALTPGNDFGDADADAYVRLSYAASMAQLDKAMVRLAQWLAAS